MIVHSPSKKGFTLLEMLLVLAIVGAAMVMLIRYSIYKTQQLKIERTTLQIQQILNASLAFYINNSRWPAVGDISATHELVTGGFLPKPTTTVWNNSYGRPFYIGSIGQKPNEPQFYVTSSVAPAGPVEPGGLSPTAVVIAGRLPLGFVTDKGTWNGAMTVGTTVTTVDPKSTGCSGPDYCSYAVGSVNIPGQNLNNARSVNFSGIYRSGACVPAPACPSNMMPQIYVAPVGVAGVYDAPPSGCDVDSGPCASQVYPISSFIAFARGSASGQPSNEFPQDCSVPSSGQTLRCDDASLADPNISTNDNNYKKYWRVCLRVVTEKGLVHPQVNPSIDAGREWGRRMGSILAITRCVPKTASGLVNEVPAGSAYDIYSPNVGWSP